MNSFVKWGFRSLALLLIIALAAIFALYYMINRSIPDYGHSFTISKGDYSVEIIRDRHAVPHIYGDDLKQTMFGLGVAHAQERLWQMTMLRRTAQGRISEIAGPDMVDLDVFLRSLDLWNLSQRQVKNLSPDVLGLLQAYSDGVNAHIAQINHENLGAGGLEFILVDKNIAPWTPQDSLSILKIMALQLSSGAENEILRTKLSTVLDPEQLKDIFYDAYIPNLAEKSGTIEAPKPEVSSLKQSLSPVGYGRESGASNAFAAAPSRSTSKKALLASDPHLKLSAPAIWMLAHLQTKDENYLGGTIPGIPLVVIGRNDKLAWGLTTANLDDQDLVIIRVDPNDPSKYETQSGSLPFEGEDIQIKVKGEDTPRVFTRLSTKFGPIIPGEGPWGVKDILPKNHMAALAWTALDPNDKSYEAGVNLMRATDVNGAFNALKDHGAPMQMFTLADSAGNIGQIAAGKMPMRTQANASKGSMPAISWAGDAGFDGFFPYAENPRSYNPSSGLLLHTNNKFVDRAYPAHFSYDWGDHYRIKRAQDLLGQRKIHSTDSFIEAQNDAVSEDARSILPLIAGTLWYKTDLKGQKAQALKMLGEWNGKFQALGPEALIYSTWLTELDQLLFSDEFGPDLIASDKVDPYRIERVYQNVNGASKWCDIGPTPEKESCAKIAEVTLDLTLERLTKLYGNNIENWRWGRVHKAFHSSDVLGKIPMIGLFANISQEVDGGSQTLLRAAYKSSDPYNFTSVHGASLRMVVNFADLEHSKFIISTGQSGNILSAHYDDLSVLWAAGEYIEIPTERSIIEANQIGKMTVSMQAEETIEK